DQAAREHLVENQVPPRGLGFITPNTDQTDQLRVPRTTPWIPHRRGSQRVRHEDNPGDEHDSHEAQAHCSPLTRDLRVVFLSVRGHYVKDDYASPGTEL